MFYLSELSRECGVPLSTLDRRLRRDGRSVKDSVKKINYRQVRYPLHRYKGKSYTFQQLSDFSVMSPRQISRRIAGGFSVKVAVETPRNQVIF